VTYGWNEVPSKVRKHFRRRYRIPSKVRYVPSKVLSYTTTYVHRLCTTLVQLPSYVRVQHNEVTFMIDILSYHTSYEGRILYVYMYVQCTAVHVVLGVRTT